MKQDSILEKYTVDNIDCAACAAKIEHGLNQLDAVESAVLDFASLTLHVKTRLADQVVNAVDEIDPQVKVTKKTMGYQSAAETVQTTRYNSKSEFF